ncbi:MAG: ATPase, T2SS/T4P/T4SS family [Opitutaceae bacterium]|nr:ATPase, T2SS/T4P/T4SS family [Opitutaceae bacterium]
MSFLTHLSEFCATQAPSDLLLQPGAPVHYFKHNRIGMEAGLIFPPESVPEFLALGGLTEWPRDRHLTLVLEGHRFRTCFYTAQGSQRAEARLLPRDIPSVESIRVPPAIVNAAVSSDHGLILVCGQQGTGKSTTLAALLQHISREGVHKDHHFYTVEDPIEFAFSSQFPLQFSQRALHEDVESYATGLATALRAKATVVLVGEIREPESALAAINTALTGNLVFATLHTGTVSLSIESLLRLIPESRIKSIQGLLAEVLRAVVCQRLVPGREGGQVAVHEVLMPNSEVEAAIKLGNFRGVGASLETGLNRGSMPFRLSLQRAYEEGLITSRIRDEFTAYLKS